MAGLLAAVVPVVLLGVSSLPSDYHVPIRGHAGEATATEFENIVCEGKPVARTGYETPLLTVLSSTFEKARRHSRWIISMSGNEAIVMHGQGIARRFLVTKRDPDGLILVDAEKDPPAYVITIDPRNSSFVYSMRIVSQTSSRGNSFVGRCRLGGP
jgi:hypothetical protein